jgi:23S rRNA (cytidine1920-2'-O)/16S rRNA (cytidine1409-2'-O)-methyltransferase
VTGPRRRLDLALVDLGLAQSRNRAQALILAGDVLINGQPARRAGELVGAQDLVELRAKPRFVSRGGEKLAHALAVFAIDSTDRVCADLGASTGGFTDCLLQGGARRVYAVDVGYGQLDARLRSDPRIVVIERTNARYLESLPEPVSIVTIDVSFISLSLIFPAVAKILEDRGDGIALVKPQFEAGRSEVGKGGVVRSSAVHRSVLRSVTAAARSHGFLIAGLTRSPLLGPKGNVEFLAHLRHGSVEQDLEPEIDRVVEGERDGQTTAI